MIYNKRVEILEASRVADGMGGYEEIYSTIKTLKASVTPTSREVSIQLFGYVSKTSIVCFLLCNLGKLKDRKLKIKHDGDMYNVVDSYQIRNKTVLTLELIDNEG